MKLPMAEKVRPSDTALLVIDIQNDFCSPSGLLARRGRDLSMIERAINRLIPTIQAARSAGLLTLYTQQIYDRSELRDLQIEQYELDRKRLTCDASGDGYHFYRVYPPANDVYKKCNFNIFSNLDLIRRLEASGMKTLVIAGVDTHYCVETAIRNGFDLGYKIVVPTDLVATGVDNIDMHERTLELVRRTYGALTTSTELIDVWSTYQPRTQSFGITDGKSAAEKFRMTAELVDTGIAIKRQNLLRQNPDASEGDIDLLLTQWLRSRPADSPGRQRESV